MNPPNTKNGALGFFRGCSLVNDARETVSQMRVSFPTFPHLWITTYNTKP